LDAASTKTVMRCCERPISLCLRRAGGVVTNTPCTPSFQGLRPLEPRVILRGVPSAAASLRRRAPSGYLPPVTPMRTVLPESWPSVGAFIHTCHAPHSCAEQLPSAKAPSGDLPGGMRCARISRRSGKSSGCALPERRWQKERSQHRGPRNRQGFPFIRLVHDTDRYLYPSNTLASRWKEPLKICPTASR